MHDQLLYNWEKGFYTLVTDDDGDFCLFTTKDKDGDLRRSGWRDSEEHTLNCAGARYGYSKEEIEELSKQYNWKVVRVIHPSKLMGKGFEVGDKVMYEGKEFDVTDLLEEDGVVNIKSRYKDDWVSPSVLTPIYKPEPKAKISKEAKEAILNFIDTRCGETFLGDVAKLLNNMTE